MKENINKFKDLYNFEFEEIKDLGYKEIEKKYLEIYKEGKEKNFTPVFLVLDDILLEKFELDMEDEETNDIMDVVNLNLEKSKSINALELLKKIQVENMEDIKENIDEYFAEKSYKFDDSEKYDLELSSLFDYNGDFKDNVILVKVPTKNPYEVLGYFGMGGFNDCPL